MNSTDELQELYRLLEIEQEYERNQYETLLSETSPAERQKNGVTWYPVQIELEEVTSSERLILSIRIHPDKAKDHKFHSGQTVSIFTNKEGLSKEDKKKFRTYGTIRKIKDEVMYVMLSESEMPDWFEEGKLGVDLFYNETSYEEMKFALTKVMAASKNRLAELREIILGYKETSIEKEKFPIVKELNTSQNEAYAMALNAKDFAVIQGPPGTGKTTTLVQIIKEAVEREKRVLVCAASNNAVDLLVEKLAYEGVNVLRIGNPARVLESSQDYTFDAKIYSHPDFEKLQDYKKEVLQIKKKAYKFKRNFGKEQREERIALKSEAKELMGIIRDLEINIEKDIVDKAEAICSTFVGITNSPASRIHFQTVFIDEATQALEPAVWISILRANRVIFCGDHKQLPPVVLSPDAARGKLDVSLFEKILYRLERTVRQNNTEVQKEDKTSKGNLISSFPFVLLDTQYRMHEEIMNFSNEYFYHGKLIAHESVKNRTLDSVFGYSEKIPALRFIDTAGTDSEEILNEENLSLENPKEAELLFKQIQIDLEKWNWNELNRKKISIGILSPYNEQIKTLKDRFEETNLSKKYDIEISTIDSFQGREKDIIYISLVRSNEVGEIGFLSDTRRMNVAMTRARMRLVVIGDSSTIGNHEFYKKFLEHVEKYNSYESAWDYY
ncbi:MAG TPA: IGHMBP2 family helicase [Leptospiraceae bacterium]|nr:IGHMBP2 family helicase [Leptospiraceae bacterium]HMW03516.1 IGHMBP2 family helicase [Leptospiraceae bacterium]HMX33479.1 IGHMBP2 family helicase [Leptospiraceae bacterium]HMY29564.1 IGHMBP2 family helicase [Leptospiraceae bacterium]HMZ67188.1 IGHMBP2 family helicase [Leptospiraceae bacterium]